MSKNLEREAHKRALTNALAVLAGLRASLVYYEAEVKKQVEVVAALEAKVI